MKLPVYLDGHATTPVDPRVLEAMLPCFRERFGNASSPHAAGREAAALVEKARAEVAALIGCDPAEIVFTSGTTESNNLALKGVWEMLGSPGAHIITQATEHKSVLDPCRYLERKGADVSVLPVNPHGRLDPFDVKKAVTGRTVLVSLMHANNEIGTIQPIREVASIAREHGALVHVDGAQAAGKIPVNVREWGVDLYSFTAHKMHGPKGVGALYVRSEKPVVRITPLLHGGGHERGLRSGTVNVPAVVGFGRAAEIARSEMNLESSRIKSFRDRMQKAFVELGGVVVHGHPLERLAQNLNVGFTGVDGKALLRELEGKICVSSASACTADKPESSHVLQALGVRGAVLHSSLRFGLGRFTTAEEIDFAIACVSEAVTRLRRDFLT
jgi:cysteine desulfurase